MPVSSEPTVLSRVDDRGIAHVTLNRPEVNNAYNGDMVDAMTQGIAVLSADAAVRLIIIRGNGRHFQAGADLTWLSAVQASDREENLAVSRRTGNAIRALDRCPKPTLALVQGACIGGGTGIIAACDVVIAEETAQFAVSEARWGLVAQPILPHLAAALGPRHARRYALTGERFKAHRALQLGLVHELARPGDLEDTAGPIIEALLSSGPEAIRKTKQGFDWIAAGPVDEELEAELDRVHGETRISDEGREGLAAFREKRKPDWAPE